MPNSYTSSQIEQFKRDAKRLARADSLSHSGALDQIAASHGYANWSQLAKRISLPPREVSATEIQRLPLRFSRTEEAMHQAMRKTTPAPGPGTTLSRLRAQVTDLSRKFVSARNAVDFAIAYVELALSTPRYLVNGQSLAYYEMRCWLPYCIHAVEDDLYVLVGRDYKPIGMVQHEDRMDYSEFSQAHLRMSEQQLRNCATVHREAEAGYLYDVGPWTSRSHAQAYLKRLKVLRDSLIADAHAGEVRDGASIPMRSVKSDVARARHYVHGDQYEGDPAKFYCVHCDDFVEDEHFEREHPGRAEERYFQSLEGWQRSVARGATSMRRPSDATNVLAAVAAGQRAAREQARSAFHRWIERQATRNDPVGDLAGDIMRDQRFPTSASSRASIGEYLMSRSSHRGVMDAFKTAWREFEASN